MARGFSRGGGGGGRAGGSGGGFSFGGGGGSSRSSGGGGFRFSSSSSSSSSGGHYHSSYGGGHYHRRPRHPWHVPMFGRTVIVSTRAQSFFSMFLVILLFCGAMCFFNAKSVGYYANQIKDQKAIVQQFETYDEDYMTLIKGAEEGTYEVQEFDITPYWNATLQKFDYVYYSGSYDPTEPGIYDMNFYHNGQEYFFIVYSYEYNGQPYTDWTFAQYSEYKLKDILAKNAGKIKIAVGELSNTASGDDGIYAMNMDYSLEANQEYQYEVYHLDYLKSERNSNILTALIFGGVDALIIAAIVLYVVKKYKQAQRKNDAEIEKIQAETAEAQANATIAEEKAKQLNRKCQYCGASVPDGDDMCPACGSRYFEK